MGYLGISLEKREKVTFLISTMIFLAVIILISLTQMNRISMDDYEMRSLDFGIDMNFQDGKAYISVPGNPDIQEEMTIENIKHFDEFREFLIRYDSSFISLIISFLVAIYLIIILIVLKKYKSSYRHGFLRGFLYGLFLVPLIFIIHNAILFFYNRNALFHALEHIIH